MAGKLRVTQIKSSISHIARNRATLQGARPARHRLVGRGARATTRPGAWSARSASSCPSRRPRGEAAARRRSEAPRPEAGPGFAKAKRRVGRGIAAGQGKTAGRGTKGQKARAGGKIPAWFEGGQTPLHQRIPKLRGFKNLFKVEYEVVNSATSRGSSSSASSRAATCRARSLEEGGAAPITVEPGDPAGPPGLVRRLDRPMKVLGGGETCRGPVRRRRRVQRLRPRRRSRRPVAPSSVLEVPMRSGSQAPRLGLDARGSDAALRTEAVADRRPLPRTAPATTARADEAGAMLPSREARAPASAAKAGRRPPTAPARSAEAPPTTQSDARREGGGQARRRRRRPRPPPSRPPQGHATPKPRPQRRVADRVRIPAERASARRTSGAGSCSSWDPRRLPAARRRCRCPGIDRAALADFFKNNSAFGILDLFAGGGLSQLSIVGLGDEPVHQRLDHHAADDGRDPVAPGRSAARASTGASGSNQYTRYLTVPMALLQAFGILSALSAQRRDHRRLRPRQRR